MGEQPRETRVERWARSASAPVALRDVEARVLREHPRAQPLDWWDRLSSSPAAGVLMLLAVAGPIGGMCAVVPYRGRSGGADGFQGFRPEVGVPLAGWCFLVSIALVAFVLARWLRAGRARSHRPLGLLLLELIPALIAIPMTRARLSETWVSPGWGVPVMVAAAAAAIGLVLVLTWSTDREPEPEPLPLDVATLSDPDRTHLLAIRRRTLPTLVDRGVIERPISTRARETPLGELDSLEEPGEKDAKQRPRNRR